MQKIFFATFNKHKRDEVAQILGKEYTIVLPTDIGYDQEPEETATTLEGNALIKAKALYEHTHTPCFADDTGLEVEALDGAPGVYSARYAGEEHNDVANRKKLLADLQSTPSPRKAQFRTLIAYIDDKGVEHLFEGIVKGEIALSEKGNNGFGYDPIFIPEDSPLSFAEMSEEEKNKISHRARAVKAFAKFLSLQKKD